MEVNKEVLLIIGGGEEQIPAYEIARSSGYLTVGTDMNESAPASKYADYFLKASTRDIQETLDAVLSFNKKIKIDGVMTIANDVPLTVAKVADKLRLRSISIESAEISSNKLQMKEKFIEFGVPCPNYYEISDINTFKKIVKNTSNKFILKPIDGCGARGVLLFSAKDNLEMVYNQSKSYTDSKVLLLEEFIDGLQISSESFLIDGNAYTAALSERNYSRLNEFLPNIIEDGGTIPAPVNKTQFSKINSIIELAAKSIGVRDGIIKGDIVIDKDSNIKIIEIATRLSGGWFCSHQIPEATGINLVQANIDFAMGKKIDPLSIIPTKDISTSIRYFFIPEGRIHDIRGESMIKNAPGLIKYDFYKNVGDYQNKVLKHSDRFGYVICKGKNRDESISNVQNAIKMIEVILN